MNCCPSQLFVPIATNATERAKAGALVPLYHETGGIHKAPIDDPKR
jgi:hypothetical protein